MNLLDCKNLIILFSPGTGGNHLKNILTVNSNFSNSELLKDLEDFYVSTVSSGKLDGSAHFLNSRNLQRSYVEDQIDLLKQSNKINILCGHLGEYLWISDLIDQLPNKLLLIISLSIHYADINSTTGQFNRLSLHNSSLKDLYLFYEQATIYKPYIISKLTNVNEEDILSIDMNLLFSKTPDKLLMFLSDSFKLIYTDKQISVINKIHKIWVKRNQI